MSTRLSSLLLASVTVVASYVILVVGDIVPRFFEVMFKLKPDDVAAFMSPPTQFATGSSWVFVVVLLLALAVALLLFRTHPGHMVRVTVATLCMESIVVWTAFFCYCFDGFCGPMTLHHGPEFDAVEFFQFQAGVFPATLVLIVVPLIGCLARGLQSSVRAEPGAPPIGGPVTRPGSSGVIEGPPSVS